MRILFMGTPDIAAESLAALLEAGHEICGVYTRRDKPVGRRQILTPPPVKLAAERAGLRVFQPKNLREGAAEEIRALAPELIVVVAYGCILPKEILELPQYGCINLHVSLLPKYRGAAPVQWAVINGDKETGVTIMYMDEGLDTGDVIRTETVPIGAEETSGELFERVSRIGAKVLCETVETLQNGTAVRTPQKEELASWAPPLTREMGEMDLTSAADKLHDLVRGLSPWPGAYLTQQGKKLKVLQCRVADKNGQPGEILSLKPLTVACGEKALELLTVVPEGKKAMEGTAFAAGRRFQTGDFWM
ncbi:MAG: methionyl-tRNA formyltransferase [Oscillospiraceae bacterium]|nr:methionyl-tRNA formyltransferase [Oscillospiraceae bacterium]